MTKYAWKVDERAARTDVKDNLPNDWGLRVFKVTSGDTGKTYWVQMLREKGKSLERSITLCSCPEGTFLAPLVILGLYRFRCKHSEAVIEVCQ